MSALPTLCESDNNSNEGKLSCQDAEDNIRSSYIQQRKPFNVFLRKTNRRENKLELNTTVALTQETLKSNQLEEFPQKKCRTCNISQSIHKIITYKQTAPTKTFFFH